MDFGYIDSFRTEFADEGDAVDIRVLAGTFAQPGPRWFEALLSLRNRIAARVSLKTSANGRESAQNDRPRWEIGERIGIFRVFQIHPDELVLGEDDRHLDFRVSLLLERDETDPSRKIYTVSTAVVFHNRLGRWYFAVVKPFHRRIVPVMIRRGFARLRVRHPSIAPG